MKFTDLANSVDHDFTDVRPYVFELKGEQSHLERTDDILASPFPKFSVELDGDWLTTAEDDGDFRTGVVYCEELGVDRYLFIVSMEVRGQTLYLKVTPDSVSNYKDGKFVLVEKTSIMYESTKAIVHTQLKKLHSGRIGLVNYAGKARFKTKEGVKSVYKPNDVIYVSNTKRSVENANGRSPKGVVWQDAWEVGSHWRKISDDSLGLNRLGERTEKGYTWIKSYTKGPDKELKKKTRKVAS